MTGYEKAVHEWDMAARSGLASLVLCVFGLAAALGMMLTADGVFFAIGVSLLTLVLVWCHAEAKHLGEQTDRLRDAHLWDMVTLRMLERLADR